jgi:NAD(P)-dependent dehydrogenase (short-subunit alcohol dehydrogenase family)
METGLKGRTAVITGGSKGIGRAIAQGLAAEGVNLVLLARTKEQLEKTAEELQQQSGVKVLAITADISNAESVAAAAAKAKERFDTVHILVNNAGGPIRRMDRQITWPDSDWLDDVNLKAIGMLRVIREFFPFQARDGSGRIINISGIASTTVFGAALTHGLNNAAMNHMTNYLASDMAKDNITVNVVIPGIVGTEGREIWAENTSKQLGKTKEEFLADFCKRMGILAGRWASMAEVADSVVFLASDRGRYINGAHFVIDGGMGVNPRPA